MDINRGGQDNLYGRLNRRRAYLDGDHDDRIEKRPPAGPYDRNIIQGELRL